MSTLKAVLITLGLWLFYLLLWPLSTSAVVVFPVAAYYLRRQAPTASLLILLAGSLLADVTVPQAAPRYVLVSLVAGLLYRELIEPHLSPGSSLSTGLGLLAWLLSWRLTYLAYLSLAAVFIPSPPPELGAVFSTGAAWFGVGLVVWTCLITLAALVNHVRNKQAQAARYYA